MYTNVLNEAFLERFPATEEQDWLSTRKIEVSILKKELKGQDDDFAESSLSSGAKLFVKHLNKVVVMRSFRLDDWFTYQEPWYFLR